MWEPISHGLNLDLAAGASANHVPGGINVDIEPGFFIRQTA
jgi:hypothetical protein